MVNPTLSLGGILMTMYDNRTKLSYEVWEEVKPTLPELSFSNGYTEDGAAKRVSKFWPDHFRIRFQWYSSVSYSSFAKKLSNSFSLRIK